jgi:hypothetical protein
MTDMMSEEFGRALNARTTFEKEAIWLPLLASHQMNGGDPVIRGKTFTDCMIQGPAVIVALGGLSLDGCNLGIASKPENLMFRPMGDQIVGAISMADCSFIRCRFAQVGFTGQDEGLQALIDSLTPASELQRAAALGIQPDAGE